MYVRLIAIGVRPSFSDSLVTDAWVKEGRVSPSPSLMSMSSALVKVQHSVLMKGVRIV